MDDSVAESERHKDSSVEKAKLHDHSNLKFQYRSNRGNIADSNIGSRYKTVSMSLATALCHNTSLMLRRHDEEQYLDQLRYIMDRGVVKSDRTGVGTMSVFGMQSRYSLEEGMIVV